MARMLRILIATMLLMAGLACRQHQVRMTPARSSSADVPSTRVATQPLAEFPLPGLFDQLGHPDGFSKPEEWRSILKSAYFYGAGHDAMFRLDATERERYFHAVAQAVARPASGAPPQLIVVEFVSSGQGGFGTYERAGVFHAPDAPVDLTAQGLAAADAPTWRAVRESTARLLSPSGSTGLERPLWDANEAAVITSFDGRQWRAVTWFYPITRIDLLGHYPPQARADVPQVTRDVANLCQLINRSLPAGAHGLLEESRDVLDTLSDYPRSEAPSAVQRNGAR
jgi:hypothetical protein